MAEKKKDTKAAVTEDDKTEAQETVEDKQEEKQEEKQEAKKEAVNAVESSAIGDLNFYADVREDLPELKPGDVIRVSYRVIEGGKERTQIFEGTIIAIKNSGITKTITVRKTSFGIAVERILPLNSKLVQKIEVKKRSKVRRAKLYFLRDLKGKAARLKELR